MNILKRAIVAALVLGVMAVATGDSASAKLCSTAGTGNACLSGHGRVFTGGWAERLTPNKKVTLKTGAFTTECNEAEAAGEYTNGETGAGKITSQTFGSCNCPLTATASAGSPWTTTATVTTAPNGKVEVEGVKYETTCLGIKCIYGSAKVGTEKGVEFIGGEKAETKENFELTKQTGSSAFCSTIGTFAGEWTIEQPTSSFLT